MNKKTPNQKKIMTNSVGLESPIFNSAVQGYYNKKNNQLILKKDNTFNNSALHTSPEVNKVIT